MKTWTARAMFLVACLVISVTTTQNQTHDTRDGNWWIGLDEFAKLSYVTGFFDGMELGYDFSFWGIMQKSKSDPAIGKVAESFDSYQGKYLTNVTNSQLVEGLNRFYSDYRNRRIKMNGAVWIVVNGIAGMSDADVEKLTESWRKSAVRPR